MVEFFVFQQVQRMRESCCSRGVRIAPMFLQVPATFEGDPELQSRPRLRYDGECPSFAYLFWLSTVRRVP